MHILRSNLIINFIAHADKHNNNADPLNLVDSVIEKENAEKNSKYFAGSRYQRIDMLLEIGNDVID